MAFGLDPFSPIAEQPSFDLPETINTVRIQPTRMRSDEVNTVLDQKDSIDVQDFKLISNMKGSGNV